MLLSKARVINGLLYFHYLIKCVIYHVILFIMADSPLYSA